MAPGNLPIELWAAILLTASTSLPSFAALTSVCRCFRVVFQSPSLKALVLIWSQQNDTDSRCRPFDLFSSEMSPRWLGEMPCREDVMLHVVRLVGPGSKRQLELVRSGRPPYLALHLAVDGDMRRVAELLLKEGFDPNAESRKGTPLCIAAKTNNVFMAQLLLSHGADPSKDGPLAVACARGSVDVATYLLDHASPADVKDALFSAVDTRNTALVQLLLTSGNADPNAIKGRWLAWRPLHQAVHAFRIRVPEERGQGGVISQDVDRVVRVLVAHGADPKLVCLDGSPEDMARRKGLHEVADFLKSVTGSQ